MRWRPTKRVGAVLALVSLAALGGVVASSGDRDARIPMDGGIAEGYAHPFDPAAQSVRSAHEPASAPDVAVRDRVSAETADPTLRLQLERRRLERLVTTEGGLRDKRDLLERGGGSPAAIAALDRHLARISAEVKRARSGLEGLTQQAPEQASSAAVASTVRGE